MQLPRSASQVVLLLDTNGIGFSQNLLMLRNEMLRRDALTTFRYYFCNRKKMTDRELLDADAKVLRLCEEADVVVCATDSLPETLAVGGMHQRRVLLHPPRRAMLADRPPKTTRTLAYTDVVVQNEQFAKYVQQLYGLGDLSAIHSLGLPAIDSITDSRAVELARRRMRDLCPQADGRRIIALSSHYEASVILSGVDLEDLAGQLAEDYFLVIAAPAINRALASYGANLSRFVFAPTKTLSTFDLLLACDMLVTTRFTDAVYHSASGRPLLYFHPTRSTAPAELASLGLENLLQLSARLQQGLDPASTDAFRSLYVSPNESGNARRVVSMILGESSEQTRRS